MTVVFEVVKSVIERGLCKVRLGWYVNGNDKSFLLRCLMVVFEEVTVEGSA